MARYTNGKYLKLSFFFSENMNAWWCYTIKKLFTYLLACVKYIRLFLELKVLKMDSNNIIDTWYKVERIKQGKMENGIENIKLYQDESTLRTHFSTHNRIFWKLIRCYSKFIMKWHTVEMVYSDMFRTNKVISRTFYMNFVK